MSERLRRASSRFIGVSVQFSRLESRRRTNIVERLEVLREQRHQKRLSKSKEVTLLLVLVCIWGILRRRKV